MEETNQKTIFENITANDIASLKVLLSQPNFNVDFIDENGMTPLQHAAYKGNKEICQLLLDQGADVNSGKHEHNYSALHFAALSGNAELCFLLLSHGARSHGLNSVNRTPSQMAAFVGNHACVAAINNFVPKADVDYYTVPRGLEKQPKLEPFLASPFHKFIMQVNIHPVHLLMYLQQVPLLVEHSDQVRRVLELMCEREMKRGAEVNEVLAFKFHWLSCIMAELSQNEDKGSEKIPVESCLKRLVRPVTQDQFVRTSVRRFNFVECTIFRQLVNTLAGITTDGSPQGSAIHAVLAAINGQRGFAMESQCSACGEEKAGRRCARCKEEIYCGAECQKVHWSVHKKYCTPAKTGAVTTGKKQAVSEVDKAAIAASVTQALSQNLTLDSEQ